MWGGEANERKARSGLCDRSLHLNLKIFERDFDPETWKRLLGADHRVQSISNGFVEEPAYGREYYRGYYLLRMLEGCVELHEPKAHPGRFTNHLAGLVRHDGEIHLMDSVLGDGFQGGSSERYLRLVMNRTEEDFGGLRDLWFNATNGIGSERGALALRMDAQTPSTPIRDDKEPKQDSLNFSSRAHQSSANPNSALKSCTHIDLPTTQNLSNHTPSKSNTF
ncbi:uncharacterized protein MYCFIDRAFT_172833 [Pseudocercospora fijiensis CIRAD86]|uniref:Uncharacterized protein n=1 Tax=Pseudocercospora fijiensis (strain CIRAD86) TaxID=383855 RepID=M3AGT9_PSEFD|nr:uncharacterized protein MYCFIDRAFT_172833 [Pseudocercospora fijiensis CIRAD86]EME83756.1 hypothetical protein MYCFIDRAFT_172833 [Pseudocercospora fijiensis CIRAD86]